MPANFSPKQRTYIENMAAVRRTSKGVNTIFASADENGVRVETALSEGKVATVNVNNPSIQVFLAAGLLERVDGTPAPRDEQAELIDSVQAENARLRAELEALRAKRGPGRPRSEEAAS